MLCHKCNRKTDVVDSRVAKNIAIMRRRGCSSCQERFRTIELPMLEGFLERDLLIALGSLVGTMMPKANQAKKQKPRKRVLKPKPQVEPDWYKMSDEEIEKFFER